VLLIGCATTPPTLEQKQLQNDYAECRGGRPCMENKGYSWICSKGIASYVRLPEGEKIESEPVRYRWSKEGISREEVLKDLEVCHNSEVRQSRVGRVIQGSTFLLFPFFNVAGGIAGYIVDSAASGKTDKCMKAKGYIDNRIDGCEK
jgi:hypothetical protein